MEEENNNSKTFNSFSNEVENKEERKFTLAELKNRKTKISKNLEDEITKLDNSEVDNILNEEKTPKRFKLSEQHNINSFEETSKETENPESDLNYEFKDG